MWLHPRIGTEKISAPFSPVNVIDGRILLFPSLNVRHVHLPFGPSCTNFLNWVSIKGAILQQVYGARCMPVHNSLHISYRMTFLAMLIISQMSGNSVTCRIQRYIHKRPQLDPIPSQLKPFDIFILYVKYLTKLFM